MATVTFIKYAKQSEGTLNGVAAYVAQEAKTVKEGGGRLVSGQNCNPQLAFQEFLATRAMHRKDSPVWFYHYVQSFAKDEPITGELAHEVAKKFAARAWPESEVLIATHIDREHIHSHFIVNSVCLDSGKMLRQGPSTLAALRPISDEICVAHGLSVLPKQQAKAKGLSAREYRSATKGESWKFQLMSTIDDCMRYARTREDFISLMKSEGYGVRWEATRKNITYTTPSGYKCRVDRLHDEKYLKEAMEREFGIRQRIISGGVETAQCADGTAGATGASAAHTAAGNAPDTGRVERPADEAQRAVPRDSGTERADEASARTPQHQPHVETSVGDVGRIGEDTAAPRTGWETERAALFAPTPSTAEYTHQPGVAVAHTGADSVIRSGLRLLGSLDGVFDHAPIKDATTMPTHHERGKKRKLAPGQNEDDHEPERIWQQSM